MDFNALGDDLGVAVSRRIEVRQGRRRLARLAIALTLGALALAGVATGAARLFGQPAPAHVRTDIGAVDRGLPGDLQLNPDVTNAHEVAASSSSILYEAPLKDGGYCTEIVTADGRRRGSTCSTAADAAGRAIQITLPSDDQPSSPVTVGGRVNAQGATTLELQYGEQGPIDRIGLGDDRFFIFDVPAAHVELAHNSNLLFTARDAAGAAVARGTVPSDWGDPAMPDDSQPLYVSTRSDEGDFTKIFGIEGHVSAPGAVALELRYSDGQSVKIPIESDGSYLYMLPSDRVDSFMRPQTLVALDTANRVIASAPVASVAYWTGKERGR
jgi:hypothetical protein